MRSLTILSLLSCLLPGLALAVDNTTQISLYGTLIENPPCTINGGSPISVEFGDDVMTTRINGKDYKKQPVPYSLSCEGDMTDNPALLLTISGTPASFGSGLLVTDKTGLAVQFLASGAALPLNTGTVNLDYYGVYPAIDAVLAKDASISLSGGEFNATATMSVNYQ